MKLFTKLIIYLSLALPFWIIIEDARADSFPLSEKCKKCHERVYDEWISSSMSQSISSPVFRIILDEYLSKEGAKEGGYCIRCHAPQAKVNPDLVDELIKQVKMGKVASDGIGCSQCHLIKGIEIGKQDIKIRYELGRILFGPYNDPVENLVHNSQYLEIYKGSDICLACHQFKIIFSNGEPCCDAFDGWKKSRAAKEGKECQSCHMKEKHGVSADEEKSRKIASHDFPGRYGELLSDAVKIDIEKTVIADQLKVTVMLQSMVPHNFPGGHPPFAQVFLDLSVRNQDYKTIFYTRRFYRRVFEDGNENKNQLEFNATKLAEDSIFKAEELKKESFAIQIPRDTKSIEIEAVLSYIPIAEEFQRIRDQIQKDSKGKRYLEIKTMAKKIESVRFH